MPPSTIAPPKTGGATSCSGEYTKLSLIGRGSFGAVWLVRHTKKGGESLVLKEVVTNGLSQSEVRSAKQEINVLKRLSHPNIIGYVTTFEESGTINIVMEFAAGGDLARLIAKRSKEKGARFTETEVRRYATQLASALEYLHREVYLLHRDIKPKNVFLSGVGDVRLGDFGLSKVLSKVDGVAEMQVGTPLYMSPELAAGKPYDRNADVWAFGCTIYEAMSFVPPWNELTTPEGGLEGGMKGLLMHIRAHELDVEALRTNYSLEMVDVVRKLLAKKPSERLPLKVLLTQFTEAPKPPPSWGLSAEAQAALDAANAAVACTGGSYGTGGVSSSSAGTATPPERLVDYEGAVKGVEAHAAAVSLQRSWRNHLPHATHQVTPPPPPPKKLSGAEAARRAAGAGPATQQPKPPAAQLPKQLCAPLPARTGVAPLKLRAPSPRPSSQQQASSARSVSGARPPSAKAAVAPRTASPTRGSGGLLKRSSNVGTR